MQGGVRRKVTLFLCGSVAAVLALWWASSDMTARWAGVPPVPSARTATVMTLGDSQLAYRSGALSLQTLGDTGGRIVPLKDYSYQALAGWFDVLDGLDPAADHVPMVAAYYFGATRVPADVAEIVTYLGRIGDTPVAEKWRWLAHAAYLARYRMDDTALALDLGYRLARIHPLSGKPLPIWARQMPAFILNAQGDQAGARDLLGQMLVSEADLHPNEVNFMKGYLVEQLGVSKTEVDQMMRLRAQNVDKNGR